jgi:ABC-type molybdate transport system substrate-binding protein
MIILFAVGVMSLAASASAVCEPGAPQLIIAGSLSAAFAAAEQLFTQQTGVCVTDVAAGSVDPRPADHDGPRALRYFRQR